MALYEVGISTLSFRTNSHTTHQNQEPNSTEAVDEHLYSYFQFFCTPYVPIRDTVDGFQFQFTTKTRNPTQQEKNLAEALFLAHVVSLILFLLYKICFVFYYVTRKRIDDTACAENGIRNRNWKLSKLLGLQ